MIATKPIALAGEIERDTQAIKCQCGGYAGKVDCTREEIRTIQTCGRNRECCIAAFVCCLCGQRIVARLEAPEME